MSAASKGATGRPWAEVGPGGDTVYRVSGGFMGQAYDSTQAGIMVRSINRDMAGLLAERDALRAALVGLLGPTPKMHHGVTRDCPIAAYHGGPCPGHEEPETDHLRAAARAALAGGKGGAA